MESKSVLVTGCAGFIGFHLSQRLLNEGYDVSGLDNLNPYYAPSLKKDRLQLLKQNAHFNFIKGSIENLELLQMVFDLYKPDIVVHLAAQAGVRYSIEAPHTYIQSNLVGFANILECCKNCKIEHLIYASSSSVYGANKKVPFSVKDRVDHPISLYAATKKANEEMAYTYSHLYNIKTTGLRFFTVYGPWGRPDMALFKFTEAIIEQKPIEVYNQGKMKRDFTYIDDVVEAIYRIMRKEPREKTSSLHKIYNIGHNQPVKLADFIEKVEGELGRKAVKILLPLQPGDVPETFADIDDLVKEFNYKPSTSIDEGIKKFIEWYKWYNHIS